VYFEGKVILGMID